MPPYLHKSISKLQAETLLRDSGYDGSYLVRDSETFAGAYVLCVWSGEKLSQYRILLSDEGLLSLSVKPGVRERKFATLDTLIQHYVGLEAQGGLVCPLCHPVPAADLLPPASAEDSIRNFGNVEVSAPTPPDVDADNITPYFRHRQATLDLSIVDGEFIEELRDYIGNHVRHDAETAVRSQSIYDVTSQSLSSTSTPHLHKLLEKAGRSLERELHLYLTKVDVCNRLFDGRKCDGIDTTRLPSMTSLSSSLDGLLKQLGQCQSRVDNLMEKARDTLSDLSNNPRDLASEMARIADESPLSAMMEGQHYAVPKYIPSTDFEIKTYKGNLAQLKSALLTVDLQAGNMIETSPGQDGVHNICHDNVEQVIKSQVNTSMVEMKLEGQKKKKVFVFSDMRAREKFCQLVQTMKNVHREEDEMDTLSMFIGSWNMGDDAPRDSLSAWLRCQGQGKPLDDSLCLMPHDFYVIGTQESAVSEKHWSNRIKKTLFNLFNIHFQTVTVDTLWGIRLVVLCKPHYMNAISHVETSTVKTGIANTLGNKGAVAISFNIYSTSVCFVCCHLTSGNEKNTRRNQNYRDILRGLTLGNKKYALFDPTKRFHHLFWFGDLNYRLEENIDTILEKIDNNTYLTLMNKDQLTVSQIQKEAFTEFSEEPITFRPTYRYEKGSNKTYAWKKIKKTTIRINVPSWCDRILWKSYPGSYVENLAYGVQDEITSSDHLPIFASFRLGVIQQYAGKLTSSSKQDDVIVIFQQCEAEVQTNCRQNFYLEFHSSCLDSHVTSSVSTSRSTNHNTSHNDISSVRWIKQSIPKLQPIVADLDFLEDQYLLIAVKSFDTNESYGECVLGLKPHINITPQYFECDLTHFGEETGVLKGEMHVTSISTAVNLSRRRRTVRTYECIQVDTGNLISLDEDQDVRVKSLFSPSYPARSDRLQEPRPPPDRIRCPSPDLSLFSTPKLTETSSDRLPAPLPPKKHKSVPPVPVADWLSSLGLTEYHPVFVSHGWDALAFLTELNEQHLKDMGIASFLHRKKILDSLKHL